MIDQDSCFGGNDRTFRDAPLQGFSHYRPVYQQVQKMEDFQPWPAPFRTADRPGSLRRTGDLVPPEWYQRDSESLLRSLHSTNAAHRYVRSWTPRCMSAAIFSPTSFLKNPTAQERLRGNLRCKNPLRLNVSKRGSCRHDPKDRELPCLPVPSELAQSPPQFQYRVSPQRQPKDTDRSMPVAGSLKAYARADGKLPRRSNGSPRLPCEESGERDS